MRKIFLFVTLMPSLLFSGCAYKGLHNKSLIDLQEQSSIQLSQQVLNAIVAVLDKAELPDFYYVEGGTSGWGSSGNIAASFDIRPQIANGEFNQASPSTRLSENLNLTNQYNDFGPAAMMRVSAIYVFLCYPINLGVGELPNGALFTAVSKSDSPDGFIIHKKASDGTYYGVTREKQLEFFKLSRDVTYWSRYLNPNPNDLESISGQIYKFFSQYPETEVAFAKAVDSYHKSVNTATQTSTAYQNEVKKVNLLEEKFFGSDNQKTISKTILEEAYKQRKFWFDVMISTSGSKTTKKNQMESLQRQADQLIETLQVIVMTIQSVDPNQEKIIPPQIIKPFHDRIKGIAANDPEVMKSVLGQLPSSAGIDAQDPLDKLYRERFEGLPPRFEDEGLITQ